MSLPAEHHPAYVLRHGDDNLILAQRLGEWVSRGPELEEDIALANLALDHLGVAQHLLEHAAGLCGDGRSADDLAFGRTEREFANLLLVEQPNGDFGHTMARQFLFDVYQVLLWDSLADSGDDQLGAIAARAVKEARYHLRHSSGWVIRLGDGTEESHRRMQAGIDAMWRFTAEMFTADDVDRAMAAAGIGVDPDHLGSAWRGRVESVLAEATLQVPADDFQRGGGRRGFHSEHLGHLLTEMQWMQRTYPGLSW
ncbi:MAG: 1,2-phenylacetyl-CoA epoxidase subunit PaaC [Acidimicrobiia bacterium]